MVQKEVRRSEEEPRKAQAVELGQQGGGRGQDGMFLEERLPGASYGEWEPLRISFLLRSVYDVLPSPSNLLKWELLANYVVQGGHLHTTGQVTSWHRSKDNTDGDLTRYSCVLADVLEREKTKPSSRNKTKGIQFVKAGETARMSHENNSLLDGSKWQMKVDLGRT